MIISYDYGHTEGGEDGSANGFVYEYAVVRQYGAICVNELKRRGHTLVNCTSPNGKYTVDESLAYRSNKSNASGATLHLCFHANSFADKAAHGAEIEVASDAGAKYGQSVLNEILKLGFANRGIKRPSLWMTGSKINAVSILIEPFFVSNQNDSKLYNCNTLGLAVATGIVNIIGGNKEEPVILKATTVKATVAATITKSDPVIYQLQNICSILKINDHHGNRLVLDGVNGPSTEEAKAKLKVFLNYVLK